MSQSVEQARQRTGLAALRQQFLGAFAGAGDTGVECLAQPLQRLFLVGLVAEQQLGQVQIGVFVLLGAGLLQVRAGLARIGLAAQAMEVLATQAPVRVAVTTARLCW